MEARFNSLSRVFKMEVSLFELTTRDKLDLLAALMREVKLDEALYIGFGFENVNAVIDQTCLDYEKSKK